MSFWNAIREKDGKQSWMLIDIAPGLVVMAVGIVAAITIPNMLSRPVGSFIVLCSIIGIGLVLFIISKIPVYRKGLLLSFGMKSMTRW